MTVSYQGDGLYNLYFGNKLVVLNEEQIDAIQECEFYDDRDNRNIGTRRELLSINEILEKDIQSLQGLLRDAEEENLKLENLLL